MFLIYDLNGPHSYDKYKKFHWQAWAGLQYLLFRNGPATSNVCEGALCWYANERETLAGLQFHFLPGAGVEEGAESAPSGNGCTTNVYQSRPRSRGFVALRSPDPSVHPMVDPNYLAEEYDVESLAEGVRIAQEILQQGPIARYISHAHRPGSILKTTKERMEFVRKTGQGALHPCGACRMGTDDLAVVDPQLRVRGIDGLRVADTSVFPRIPSGNLNAPAIMVGERASDLLRGNRL
jgi:choline dehydrogenase-like flavoprotein